MPTQKQLENAVRAARLYAGSLATCTVRDQQRLYRRYQQAMRPIESATSDAWDQIAARASSLGPLIPQPGKDL